MVWAGKSLYNKKMENAEIEKNGDGATLPEVEKLFQDWPKMQDFIANRGIKPEDFHLIEALAAFPRDLIIMELHNVFNTYQEESAQQLEAWIGIARDETRKALFTAALEFFEAYPKDWTVAWNLERILERGK
jgi:hypothetical protein